MAIFNSYFDITRGYPPRSSQAAFAESHPTTGEKLCDELRDGWLFCYHQHLPGLKIDPKMWSKWDGIENLTHLTRLEATWNGSWCFYGKPSYREESLTRQTLQKTRPTSCQFQWQLFWCQRVASQKKYPSPMIFHWNGWSYSTISGYPSHQKSSIYWHQTLRGKYGTFGRWSQRLSFCCDFWRLQSIWSTTSQGHGIGFWWYMDGIWMVYGWDYGMVMVIMNLMKLDEDPFLKFIHAIFFDFDAMLWCCACCISGGTGEPAFFMTSAMSMAFQASSPVRVAWSGLVASIDDGLSMPIMLRQVLRICLGFFNLEF